MRTKSVLAIVILVSLMGCVEDAEPVEVIPAIDPIVDSAPIPRADILSLVDDYMEAVLARDAVALGRTLSTEVVEHGNRRGFAAKALVEKLRSSMFRTFNLDIGSRPRLVVGKITKNGDTYELKATLDGQVLKKSIFVVLQDGQLKMSIAAPGFSRDFRSNSNYQLHNTNYGGDPVNMECEAPNYTGVWPGQTVSKSCQDVCGYWSGSTFAIYGSSWIDWCDWNSWGDDVIINWNYAQGWVCNDNC